MASLERGGMTLAEEVHAFQSEQLAWLESIYITMVVVEAKAGCRQRRGSRLRG
jgi:hypothetical protein